MPPTPHNHVVNHIALSVADCDAAVDWYGKVFGFQRIRPDRMTTRIAMPNGPIFKIYGPALQRVKVAFLGTGNSVGFEVFEFIDPPHQAKESPHEFHYARSGFFHICCYGAGCRGRVRTGDK